MTTFSVRSDHFRTEIETVTIKLERRFEYDAIFLRDRFVYLARSGGRQGYSAMAIPDTLEARDNAVMDVVREHLPDMRRTAIDGALQLGYEKDLARLRSIMREMQENIDHLSRPWHRKTRDALADFWLQIKAVCR